MYQTDFFTNKVSLIEAIKRIRELEAADRQDLHLYVDGLKDELLNYKTVKFNLISRTFFEDTPNSYDPASLTT